MSTAMAVEETRTNSRIVAAYRAPHAGFGGAGAGGERAVPQRHHP